MAKILFVTGTDTGVGKTLLTASLVYHLRQGGIQALGMKPFCSGSRRDVNLIQSIQNGALSEQEINPYYFSEPIAPLIAARKHSRRIQFKEVIRSVRAVAAKCECLVVEGSGGLLVPLGESYAVADLIVALRCAVLVVARNRLGTINHTLLTAKELQARALGSFKVVLMNARRGDVSSASNLKILRELLYPVPVLNMPFLGTNPGQLKVLKKNHKKIKKVLAQILD